MVAHNSEFPFGQEFLKCLRLEVVIRFFFILSVAEVLGFLFRRRRRGVADVHRARLPIGALRIRERNLLEDALEIASGRTGEDVLCAVAVAALSRAQVSIDEHHGTHACEPLFNGIALALVPDRERLPFAQVLLGAIPTRVIVAAI